MANQVVAKGFIGLSTYDAWEKSLKESVKRSDVAAFVQAIFEIAHAKKEMEKLPKDIAQRICNGTYSRSTQNTRALQTNDVSSEYALDDFVVQRMSVSRKNEPTEMQIRCCQVWSDFLKKGGYEVIVAELFHGVAETELQCVHLHYRTRTTPQFSILKSKTNDNKTYSYVLDTNIVDILFTIGNVYSTVTHKNAESTAYRTFDLDKISPSPSNFNSLRLAKVMVDTQNVRYMQTALSVLEELPIWRSIALIVESYTVGDFRLTTVQERQLKEIDEKEKMELKAEDFVDVHF